MNVKKSQDYKNLVAEMQKKYPIYGGKCEVYVPIDAFNKKGDPFARKIVQDYAATFSNKNDFYDTLKEIGITWPTNSKGDKAIYEMRAKEALRIAIENGFNPFDFVTKNDLPVELFRPSVNGKNICEEINLYTYWQGFGYAKNTPHIKYLLVAQDFGNIFDSSNDRIKRINNGEDIPYFETTESVTDNNLIKLFEILGYDITKRHGDLFFTNFCLGYRSGKEVGGMTKEMLMHDSAEFKKLCDILEPENILCLGKITFEAVYESLTEQKYSVKGSYNEFLENHENFVAQCGGVESKIFPLAHCGYMGTMNRNKNLPKQNDVLYYQKQDWKKILEE